MNIHGPNLYRHLDRIQPVERDRHEEDSRDGRQRRRVLYRGREWADGSDEELPVQPYPTMLPDETKEAPREGGGQVELDTLHTIEEKVAKLLILVTDASYESARQTELEHAIAVFQIGGLLFTSGDFRRQKYLISCYQNLSKTPLLIGNDFMHGLSFYFEGSPPHCSFNEKMTQQRCLDIGRAVMAQNRALGVHFQLDPQRCSSEQLTWINVNKEQIHAFRRGVREGQGIVARTFGQDEKIEEVHQLKTLNLLDLTGEVDIEQRLLEALRRPYDAILIAKDVGRAIAILAKAVRSGAISEEIICRKLLRLFNLR